MSSFGYGSSYQEKQSQPSMGAPGGQQQLVPANTPGYAGTNYAPVTPQPMNFNPEARNPWQNSDYNNYGTSDPQGTGWFNTKKDPFAENWGGDNSLRAQGMGAPAYEEYKKKRPVLGPSSYAPTDFNQFFGSINNLTPDQLRNIDSRGTYDQQFRNTAQGFSDMLANPALAQAANNGTQFRYGLNNSPDATSYGQRYWGIDKGTQQLDMKAPERQFNQQNVGNWLEGAYNSLMSKLNDAYLL